MEINFVAQAVWYGLINGASYVIFAIGLILIFGVMSVFNIAHGEIAMIGAMFAYALMTYLGLNYFLALPLAIALVGGCGVILNRVAIKPLRTSPLSVYLSTIAVGFILLNGDIAIFGINVYRVTPPFTGRAAQVAGVVISQEAVLLLLLGAAGMVALHLILTKTWLGKTMRATAQNSTGASLIGINTNRVYDSTLFVASALAALAGVLIATVWTVSPYMGQRLLLKGFVVVILGGMGNIMGVVAIGLGIGILEALFGTFVSPFFREAFIYGIMIVVLMLKPEGLFAVRR